MKQNQQRCVDKVWCYTNSGAYIKLFVTSPTCKNALESFFDIGGVQSWGLNKWQCVFFCRWEKIGNNLYLMFILTAGMQTIYPFAWTYWELRARPQSRKNSSLIRKGTRVCVCVCDICVFVLIMHNLSAVCGGRALCIVSRKYRT